MLVIMSAGSGRSVWLPILQNFLKSIRIVPQKGKQVGQDNLGNSYYEAPVDTYRSRKTATRWFVPKEKDDWQQNLPSEWEAWLRGRRKDPPSEEELTENATIAEIKKVKGKEIQERANKEREGLVIESSSSVTKDFPKYNDYEKEPGGYTQYEKKGSK